MANPTDSLQLPPIAGQKTAAAVPPKAAPKQPRAKASSTPVVATASPEVKPPVRETVAKELVLRNGDGSVFDPGAEEVRLVAEAEKQMNAVEAVAEQERLGQWTNIPPGLERWHFFYAGQMGDSETEPRVAYYLRKRWVKAPKHPGNNLPPYMVGMEQVLTTSVVLCCPPAIWAQQRASAALLAQKRHEQLYRRFGNDEKYRLRDEIRGGGARRSDVTANIRYGHGTPDDMASDMRDAQF